MSSTAEIESGAETTMDDFVTPSATTLSTAADESIAKDNDKKGDAALPASTSTLEVNTSSTSTTKAAPNDDSSGSSNHQKDDNNRDDESNPPKDEENNPPKDDINSTETTSKPPQQPSTTNATPMAKAPFHVLMLPLSHQQQQLQPRLLSSPVILMDEPILMLATDRKLRRDYLSRRFRAFNRHSTSRYQNVNGTVTGETANHGDSSLCTTTIPATTSSASTSAKKSSSKYQRIGQTTNYPGTDASLWSGASSLEIALIDCCELPPLPDETTPTTTIATIAKNNNHDDTTMSSPPRQDNDDDDDVPQSEGGSLARGYEVQFAGLVAKHCHSFASRVLALAILERTLEQDQNEALEALEDKEDDEEEEKEAKNSTDESEGESENGGNDDKEEHNDDDDDDGDDDDDYDPNEKSTRRRRSRRELVQPKRKRGRPRKQQPQKEANANTSNSNHPNKPKKKQAPPKSSSSSPPVPANKGENSTAVGADQSSEKSDKHNNNDSKKPPPPDRMTVFFAAGGLKILKCWLMEAMSPELIDADGRGTSTNNNKASTTAAAPPQTRSASLSSTQTTKPKFKPSPYGPMLLPLLVLLSKIPFDKNLIVESKINKQLRRLSKQVDGLVDNFKKQNNNSKGGNSTKEALETFVDPAAGVGGCVVIRVQETLNELKSIWEDHAKKSMTTAAANPQPQQQQPTISTDPFESVKNKLRERLAQYKDHAAGTIAKPDWLAKCEDMRKDREKKRPRKLFATVLKKASTQQLALKERKAERIALKDKLKAAQEERKTHLERLKNQINKRIRSSGSGRSGLEAAAAAKRRKTNGKNVKWKDGLLTDKIRKREMLEEVFILKNEIAEPSLPPPTTEPSASLAKKKEEEKEEGAPLKQEDKSPRTFDEHGLFDFDETLLL